jgi:hypothetical protein
MNCLFGFDRDCGFILISVDGAKHFLVGLFLNQISIRIIEIDKEDFCVTS